MIDHLPRLFAALANRYTIERELGRGGMATVYLAQDLKHRRQVALKVLRPELTQALGADRFLLEIEIAARFVHPHILPVFDSGEADRFLYYVMPYVAGESLRSRLTRVGPLSVDDAVEIACEVADALAYAHGQGIVHRDIKPENILLEEGHAIVSDFGIARAISAAAFSGDEQLTAAGLALGTPLYMSPEQAAGQLRLDGRADIYSLGCVLYEMLVGSTPFTGPTPQSVAAQHAQDSPPMVRDRRPGVPPQVELAITRALQKLPADRFATATEFAAALPQRRTPPDATTPLPIRPGPRRRHISRAVWAIIGALTLAGGLTATAFRMRSTPALDPSLYVVLPFRHRAQSAPRLLNGDQCESLLHDALARWRGVQMVDPLWVADARQRRGAGSSIEDGLSIARERRAGRVVLGEVWEFQDTIYVRGLLYDPGGSSRLIREHAVRIAPDLSDAQAKFQELADSLLIGGGSAAGAPPRGGGGGLSLPAWRAFQDAYAAMQRWDLDSAKARLQRALAIDPTYAAAQLSMAQVMAWQGDEPKSWKQYAAGALASPDSLTSRDRGVAEGLTALSEQRYPQACEQFRQIIARDSLDFAAWYGLGLCQGTDPLVVRDARSPSGWTFRGSYQGAVDAYRRALEIVPSAYQAFRGEAFNRLPDLLYTESNHIRQGFALTPDTVRFGAYPSMVRDTLEFLARPIAEVVAARPGAIPPGMTAALAHNRETLRDIATSWVKAFSDRAEPHETLALVLESLGELTAGRSKDYSALGEIRRARGLAQERLMSLRLANSETRFLLKSEQMVAARTLADSLLKATPDPTLDEARQLRGLAALTGQVHLAAQLQRRAASDFTFLTPDWEEVNVPLPLTDAALGLYAYAAFGTPVDSLVTLEERVERLIPSYVEPTRRLATREALLDYPALLAFPERGIRPMHRSKAGRYLLVMQWELGRKDTSAVRQSFRTLEETQRDLRPADVAFDGTYHEAWLLLAIGDTTRATQLLDLSLDALPTLRSEVLDQLPQVATLVRGMALRADLATKVHDSTTARRWAQDVVHLWSGADPELQPTVQRMHSLVQVSGN